MYYERVHHQAIKLPLKQKVRPIKPLTKGASLSSPVRLRDAAKTLFAQNGYEKTTTQEICRMAGTSQSQLVSHFGSKQGLLEAIFDQAWGQINPAVRLAAGNIPSARERLRLIADMVLSFLTQDPELLVIFLLEGRRIRGEGKGVMLAASFLRFVAMIDEVTRELKAQGELLPGVDPQAFRSALMGAFEGLVRDRLLANSSEFPASYSDADMRIVFQRVLACCLKP